MPDQHEDLLTLLYDRLVVKVASPLEAVCEALGTFPDHDLDDHILACAEIANAIEEFETEEHHLASAAQLWKLASILACDAAQIRRSGIPNPSVSEAIEYWNRSKDVLFFDRVYRARGPDED